MQWIESIERSGGRLAPVCVNDEGQRRIGSLTSARDLLPARRGSRVAKVEGAALDRMIVSDAGEYLDAFGMKGVDPSGHQVFTLHSDGLRILVPTAVLLTGLIGQFSRIGDHLLHAASLDRIAFPYVREQALRIEFHRKTRLAREGFAPAIQARFTWLTCYASARRMWDSVHANASAGRLGLTPAEATFDASFYGFRTPDAVIATRIAVRSLTPSDRPLAFAAPHLSGAPLVFYEHAQTAARMLNHFRSSGAPNPRLKRQADLPLGPGGWKMTDAEWRSAYAQLRAAGYGPKMPSKDTIDIALEKFGAGCAWLSMGPRWETAHVTYKNWVRRGQWDALKRILTTMRTSSQQS